MQAHLFVYGSLVRAAGHPNGSRLRAEALLVGPATIAGRLYRVSWYPALRPAVTAADRVQGEVYRMADPAESLAWLDEYEGITQGSGSGAPSEAYIRADRPVRLADGAAATAWVYLYQLKVPDDARIVDGIWRG